MMISVLVLPTPGYVFDSNGPLSACRVEVAAAITQWVPLGR